METRLTLGLIGIVLLSILSCNEDTAPVSDNFGVEVNALQDMLSKRVDALPAMSLDSIAISSDTLFVSITDNYAGYANPVLYNQNFALIFQDFVHISSAPFSGIIVKYRLSKRDPVEFFTLYSGNLDMLKSSLRIFINPPITKLANSIVHLHKKYPEISIIDRLNTALADRLRNPQVENDLFFGADFFDVAVAYLVECEQRTPGRFSEIVLETIQELREDLGNEVAEELSACFSQSCSLTQELNPK